MSEPVPPATDPIRREWVRRIGAEYRSGAIASQLCHWLIQLGTPRNLIDDCMRIVSDELDHAELSAQVCAAAGAPTQPRLEQAQLGIARTNLDLASDVTLVCLRSFCLSKTIAVPLFSEMRNQCTQPDASRALDRILRDEERHREFGWDLLHYLLQTQAELRVPGQAALADLFAELRGLYGQGALSSQAEDPAHRAWGLMPPALYRSVLAETLSKQYVPRFSELDMDARAAWDG